MKWLCRIGLHAFRPVFDRKRWLGHRTIKHYQCKRCGKVHNPPTATWDGTDNA